MSAAQCEHLVVLHYHLRPGGVRRVVEMALPEVVRAGGVRRVTVLVGEGGAEDWVAGLRWALQRVGAELAVVVDERCRYGGGGEGGVGFAWIGADDVVWAHNLGLGRNLWLASEVRRWAENGTRVVSHHHDFWFENRWARWEEMRAAGAGSIADVGEDLFPSAVRHTVINGLDGRGLDGSVVWPNPVSAVRDRSVDRAEATEIHARNWLLERWGVDGEYWVVPTRFLRRKNLAEAVLLHRWLRPTGWLVTTAGVSSEAEADYARALGAAAREGKWRVQFAVLAGDEPGGRGGPRPTVEDVVASAEAVMMTSVQEGFGLPYLEAAAAGRPLVARRLPNVVPDLESWGLEFPQGYGEVWIDAGLLDLGAESRRQVTVFETWRERLPKEVRELAAAPDWLFQGDVGDFEAMSGLTPEVTPRVAFGRLTLAGQLEVLAVDPAVSWEKCRRLNPGMAGWRSELRVTAWPVDAERNLGVAAYGKRFWELFALTETRRRGGGEIQAEMIRERLGAGYLFPILME